VELTAVDATTDRVLREVGLVSIVRQRGAGFSALSRILTNTMGLGSPQLL
jgi:hypothetical protein